MRDYQLSKVYNWEDNVLAPLSTNLSEGRVLRLVDRCCQQANVRPISYVDTSPSSSAYALYNSHSCSLVLPEWAHNTHHVIHEVAHHIVGCRHDLTPPHGPEFVGVMIRFFARQHRLSVRQLIQSARDAGLDVK